MKPPGIACRSLVALVVVGSACGGSRYVTAPAVVTAPLTVFVTDAVGNLAAVRVTVSRLSVYDTSGHEAVLSPPQSEIDLVAAHDNPAKLGVFDMPVGSYNRVRGAITVVGFTTVEHPDRTCRFEPNPVTFDFATDKGALMVNDQGLKITVDVPLDPHAECPADGAVGTLSLQTITVRL